MESRYQWFRSKHCGTFLLRNSCGAYNLGILGFLVSVMILFLCLVSVALVFAISSVVRAEPVYAILSLMVVFFCVAMVFLLVGAEFVALSLLMLYLGAVLVLFLSVVMMIDRRAMFVAGLAYTKFHWMLSAFMGLFLFLVLAGLANITSHVLEVSMRGAVESFKYVSVDDIGSLLFSDSNVSDVVWVACLLLVAVVGAVLLTHRDRNEVKSQDPRDQVRRSSRVRLCKVSFNSGVSLG